MRQKRLEVVSELEHNMEALSDRNKQLEALNAAHTASLEKLHK